ncbi:MAG: OmpA family protein, partial [Nitriliruptorales bacterium]|nr:OmpA family protein [Nitriliruptorales bacterium]
EAILASDDDIRLRIEGNTDSTGDAASNLELSQQRAQAVVDALVTRGVDASRLEAVGRGETNLLIANDEDNDLAKQVNRRVEIHLVQ